MKKLLANATDATAVNHQICSEKKCATCFENRGCMYEQYLMAAIQNPGEPYPDEQHNQGSPIWKQGDLNFNNYPSLKIHTA